MKQSTELTPEHEAIVTVQVEQEELDRALQRAAQHVSRLRPVSGFRPGKAPYALVERAVGKDLLLDEALDLLSQDLYSNVLEENKLEPADRGRLDVVQKEPPILKYTIPLRPSVKLGDYTSIHLTPNEVQVTDQEVDEVLNRFQMSQATVVPVSRGVQNGDQVTLELDGGVEGHERVTEKNLRVTIGSKTEPGLPFEDQLVGMTAGETRQIAYTYPQDYQDEAFRGQTAHYTVTVQDIKETQLPELNDEFAKAISQFQTLDQFRGNIRDILRRQKEREAETEFADKVIDAIVEQSEIAYPPVMLDRQLEQDLTDMKEDVRRLGLTWQKYLELAGKPEEQARDQLRPRAERELRRVLVLNELLDAEKPEVSREEINQEIERRVEETAKAGGNPNVARRSYNTRDARNSLEFNLRLAKLIGKLVAMAKGEPVSGRILTPEMVREEGRPIPSGLITDPRQVREQDWPKGLERNR